MSVEQTSQLIQLILNSVVMVMACVMVLGGVLVRHTATKERLRLIHREYVEVLDQGGPLMGDRFFHLRNQLFVGRHQQQISQRILAILSYALSSFLISTLALALRTVWFWNGLIHTALVVFILGLVILLLGVGFMVLDVQASDRPLLEEIRWVLSLGRESNGEGKSKGMVRPRAIRSSSTRRVISLEQPVSPRAGIN